MTTGPAAGFKTNLKFWNPNCQNSNFKRTPHVLQVSGGAKTECKMTAWVPSFDFAKNNLPRRALFEVKIEKKMIFEGLRDPKRK